MGLNLQHFDTRTGQYILIPNADQKTRKEQPQVVLSEKIENTLLEAFVSKEFPDSDYSNRFSIGHIDEVSSPEELYSNNHPNGQDVLLLSSKSRLIYGPPEVREKLINKLNPDKMHNGAYGSIMTGECKNAYQGQATYLVIDDSNGENGDYLDNEQAWKLVGDCHGKISPTFSQELSDTTNRVLQFRFGNLDDSLYGKGTLAPKEISSYFKDEEIGKQVAFIIPTSSFKGAGKGTVKPGLYTKAIWLGEKERSQQGDIALSQLQASFPEALKDFIPKLEDHLSDLKQINQDPRSLAKHYCDRYEERLKKSDKTWKPPTPSETVSRYRNQLEQRNQESHEFENEDDQQYEEFLYLAFKADPNHQRLLGSKKFTQALQDFIRRDYLEAAVGKIFKFDRAMIIPSKDLKTGEICVPWMDDGEKVLNFRSPFLNHNGMLHSTNKYVEDMYASDGSNLEGVIIVNDEDYSRIVQRTITEAKTAKPEANLIDVPDNLNDLSVDERIAFTDELNQAFQEAGIEQSIPYESDCERMGADFDGDCIGIAEASRFPNLTKDVIEKTQLENLFRPTRKEAKLSFPDGTDFEVMAIHMADSITVGSINNAVTSFEASLSELELCASYGTPLQKKQMANDIISKAQWALNQQKNSKKTLIIPDSIRANFHNISQLSINKSLIPEQINAIFAEQKSIYRDMIALGCYENQIAVDLFKSARKGNSESIKNLTQLLPRPIDYFKKKKEYSTYRTTPLEVNGYSPVELTAAMVNKQFVGHQLIAKPPEQFKGLLGNDYTQQQQLEAKLVKANYDEVYNRATAFNKKLKIEDGPIFKVTTEKGQSLEINNYKKFISHHDIQRLSQNSLNLRVVANDDYRTKNTHSLLAQYQTSDDKWVNLGTVCNISQTELGLKPGLTSKNCTLQLCQSLSKNQVQLLFKQAEDIAKDWRKTLDATQTSESVKQYAAAAWELCHNNSKDTTNNFVYAVFGDKILEQISQPELSINLLVGELKAHNQVPEEIWKSDKMVDLEMRLKDDKPVWHIKNPETGDYQPFGVASGKKYQLPIGTKVKGTILGDLFTTARLDIDHPQLRDTEIIVGNMVKYPKVGHEFRNESAKIILSQNNNSPPQPIIKLEGKQLGQLDSNAVALFKENERFRDQLSFEVTLTSFGQGNTRELIATTAKGSSFKIEKSHFLADKDLKERDFTGEKISLTLSLETPKKQVMIAQIKQPDGTLLPIGEFTTNQKASKEALTQVGLFRNGATFEAKITSRVTAARIKIDPNTIEYPEPEQQQQIQQSFSELSSEAKHFTEVLSNQPSLLYTFKQDWQENDGTVDKKSTLGLTVDMNRVEATKAFLDKQQIPYVLLSPDDPIVFQETERGYGVFWMVQSDIPIPLRQQIETAVEGVYSAELVDSFELSPYDKKLAAIAKLSQNRLNDRLERSQAAFKKSDVIKIPLRQMSTATIIAQQKTLFFEPIPIVGKPIAMNYGLRLHGDPNTLPVSTTLDAMRGHGRIHTTRTFEPHQAYGFKEEDLAIAYSGEKAHPTQQVLFRVGKQYKITHAMIDDPQYRQKWANSEKHSPIELDSFRGKEAWGLYLEPIGDYRDGRVFDFLTGVDITQDLCQSSLKPQDPAALVPYSSNPAIEKNRLKDREMASLATQFIGVPAQSNPEVASSTRDYQTQWTQYGLANTGNYSKNDVIMVSGSGPWRGVSNEQIAQTFKQHYQHLLDQAISAKANFVVGNAQGTDQLVQAYLKEHEYQITDGGKGYKNAAPQLLKTQTADPQTNGKHPPPPSTVLQAQRTQQIAPIVRSYLDLCQTHHKVGKEYTATWDKDSQILSLVKDNQIKLMATIEGNEWKSIPIPLLDPTQPNLTEKDVEHFNTLAPQIEDKLSKRREANRTWYESGKAIVLSNNPQLTDFQQIDCAIAATVLAETNNPKDVAQILSQCDFAQQWRQELPENEYRNQLISYVKEVFEEVEKKHKKELQNTL